MAPQLCSQLKGPGFFHLSSLKERMTERSPASATMARTATDCSTTPGTARPLLLPAEGQPVSKL